MCLGLNPSNIELYLHKDRNTQYLNRYCLRFSSFRAIYRCYIDKDNNDYVVFR
jgi:hypothetical protein